MSGPRKGLLLVLACSGAAVAQSPFFRTFDRENLSPGPGPVETVRLADVDGDGDTDLLLRASDGAQVWYRNDGHAAFTGQVLALGDSLAYDTAIADVDGDGDDDLLLQGRLHRNLGGGQFVVDAPAIPATALGIDQQRCCDLDGDGALDLLARPLATATTGLRAFHNDGTGRFTEITASAFGLQPAYPSSFVTTDADSDGDADVVVLRTGVLQGELWRNDGSGHFTGSPLAALPSGVPTSRVLATGDLDGDGDADLLVDIPGSNTHVLQNGGTGSYTAAVTTGLLAINAASLFDLDGDGRLDVCDGATGGRTWRNLGGLQFAASSLPPFPWSAAAVQFCDLDGDGDLDGVAAGERLRIVLGCATGFRDARLPLVLRARPANVAPTLRAVSVRADDGPVPAVEVGWLENGVPRLLSSRDPAGLWQAAGTLHLLALPSVAAATGLALCDDVASGMPSLLVCTPAQLQFWRRTDAYTLIDASGVVHAVGAPSSVACADLSGDGRHEVVLGGSSFAGPQILAFDLAGQLQPTFPVLPAVPPSTAPLFEQVHVGDLDGDGDQDIVHELRIVRNDGNGVWSPGPGFASLVPANATGLCLADADRDGDLDLIVWTPTLVQLLENRGSSLVDSTFGHLPLTMSGTTGITAGDVDRDGDLDLLQSEGALFSTLLRNDGGVFTRFRNVAPVGALVDVDHDLAPDVFDGFTVVHDAFCHLGAPRLPGAGADYRLAVHTWRTGPGANLAFVGIALASSWQVVPGLGILRLDPASTAGVLVVLSTGAGEVALPIPQGPWVFGVRLVSQALVLDPAGRLLLSGAGDEVVR